MQETTRLTPACLLEIKRGDVSTEGVFTGLASVFGNVDAHGDTIRKGAFVGALETHKRAGTKPAMLWSHDISKPIGAWLNLKESGEGLVAVGKLTMATRRGKEAAALLRDNALGLSIGFILGQQGNFRENSHGGREIIKIDQLAEVSLVAIPSNPNARVRQTKHARPTTPREFETQLRDALGLSAREAKRACAGGYSALVRDGRGTDLDQVFDSIQQLRNDLKTR